MKGAFYAPMKPPDDPVPSGDRTMARAIIEALRTAEFVPELATRFRSREPVGDRAIQSLRINEAKDEISKVILNSAERKWQFWLTYHNYYKAPDLIGPAVSKALGIPYFIVEATRARKRFDGPWDLYARAAENATDAAHCVFYLTQHDAEALKKYAVSGQRLVHLAPFLNSNALPPASPCPPQLMSVGMFRGGDKLRSYEIIAQTLSLLKTPDWQLSIVGDGPERDKVADLMAPFGPRVSMRGALSSDEMQRAYATAGVLLWPGVNEAFGMAYLEAQAAGLPVVAQDRPGVRDVLAPGMRRPDVDEGPGALAHQIDRLHTDDKFRKDMGQAARDFIAQHHLLKPAASTLRRAMKECQR